MEPTEPYILKKGYFWIPKIISDPSRTCVEKNLQKYFDDTLHPTPDEVFDILLCFRCVVACAYLLNLCTSVILGIKWLIRHWDIF